MLLGAGYAFQYNRSNSFGETVTRHFVTARFASPLPFGLTVAARAELLLAFYRDQVGFHLDHDTRNEHMHVVQLTPPGSGCSIVLGDLPSQRQMAPGSLKGLQLVVADARAAREQLLGRGVECTDITVFDERDGGTFFGFHDPDGNTWAVQELRVRAERPLIPPEARGRFGE